MQCLWTFFTLLGQGEDWPEGVEVAVFHIAWIYNQHAPGLSSFWAQRVLGLSCTLRRTIECAGTLCSCLLALFAKASRQCGCEPLLWQWRNKRSLDKRWNLDPSFYHPYYFCVCYFSSLPFHWLQHSIALLLTFNFRILEKETYCWKLKFSNAMKGKNKIAYLSSSVLEGTLRVGGSCEHQYTFWKREPTNKGNNNR